MNRLIKHVVFIVCSNVLENCLNDAGPHERAILIDEVCQMNNAYVETKFTFVYSKLTHTHSGLPLSIFFTASSSVCYKTTSLTM